MGMSQNLFCPCFRNFPAQIAIISESQANILRFQASLHHRSTITGPLIDVGNTVYHRQGLIQKCKFRPGVCPVPPSCLQRFFNDQPFAGDIRRQFPSVQLDSDLIRNILPPFEESPDIVSHMEIGQKRVPIGVKADQPSTVTAI